MAEGVQDVYLVAMTYDADLQLFIDGNWRSGEGRDTHSVINPVSGSGTRLFEIGGVSERDIGNARSADGIDDIEGVAAFAAAPIAVDE